VACHAHSTYIQANNQEIRDKKPFKKAQIFPKTKKTTQTFEKIYKKYIQKWHMTPAPKPKSHNFLIGS